jgi:Adenylate kinase (EC 2.7.4.3)
MRVIIIGPPGSGKSTQADAFAQYFHIPHISTGEMFREAFKAGTIVGKKAKQYENSGSLVPDELTIEIVRERLNRADCSNGFLLDGFPRNVAQAYALDKILQSLQVKLDGVIDIEVDEEKLLERITNRRVCSQCGETYHLTFNPPAREAVCDICGGKLCQRSDDTMEIARNRIKVYYEQTEPLIHYYRSQGLLIAVQGDQEIDKVLRYIINGICNIVNDVC